MNSRDTEKPPKKKKKKAKSTPPNQSTGVNNMAATGGSAGANTGVNNMNNDITPMPLNFSTPLSYNAVPSNTTQHMNLMPSHQHQQHLSFIGPSYPSPPQPQGHYTYQQGYTASPQQDTYRVEVVGGNVYVNTDRVLSLRQIKPAPACDAPTNVVEESIKDLSLQDTDEDSLCYWAVKILKMADPNEKVRITHQVGERWKNGEISKIGYIPPPDQPSRDADLNVVAPGKERKRGKGGSLSSRISILHSLANIEQWAIDLAWDIIARFSREQVAESSLPKQFFDDFVQVACEEAKHFDLISQRLQGLGSHFGALSVHNALWDSARETSDSLLSRLAVLHMVHEARGLDVQPKTLDKFSNHGDEESVKVLEIIYKEEITHVATGLRWFTYICKHSQPPLDCIPTFHEIVKKYFRGYLKPPFNTEGRTMAGMVEEWYLPLVKPKTTTEMSANESS